ncbi:sigma-70 family RNA polymerase sigma factor [Dyadobacter aurulentus]|uniref:sigma-70 family RNA polymerase sigma factor n=1 Tax=Dyadobacter sp. UC 10 TaxID=2605428 RepID=UPI0011F1D30D|nr:sigma-70 family RNA polymerase sigma factor [Dyadobacter sp. UC 10]KAA0989132.1 sigma-70 family RNA polymerase sigma factor [Dyadobacter sp. UC 10]
MTADIANLLSELHRSLFGKMVAVLMYHTGIEELSVSEDIVQEAFAIAVDKWRDAVPEQPDAWLFATIRNLAYNHLKKEKRKQYPAVDQIAADQLLTSDRDLLRVLFSCLQPAYPPRVQLVVVLKYVCGLKTKHIAALLASGEDTISKTLYRWRVEQSRSDFMVAESVGNPDEQKIRMALKVLYVMFTAGYQLSEKGTLTDEQLCEDTLSLLQEMMKMNIVANGEVKALYALLLYNLARAESRTDQLDELTALAGQDRRRWNREMIVVANHYLLLSQKESSVASAWQLEAAIAYKHMHAGRFQETDWQGIASLYEKLVAFNSSPFTKIGQAAALYFGGNEAAAIEILSLLHANRFFRNYHLLHCFWAKMHADRNDTEHALASYKKALSCPVNAFERRFIEKEIGILMRIKH